MSDQDIYIAREGTASPVRDSREDWISNSFPIDFRCRELRDNVVGTAKKSNQGISQSEQLQQSWNTHFHRARAEDNYHLQMSINPAYHSNSGLNSWNFDELALTDRNGHMNGDHVYANLPQSTHTFLSVEEQSAEKNCEILGRQNFLPTTRCSTAHGQDRNKPMLTAPLPDHEPAINSSSSALDLTETDQAHSISLQHVATSQSFHQMLPKELTHPTPLEVKDDAYEIPTVANSSYQSFLPQKSKQRSCDIGHQPSLPIHTHDVNLERSQSLASQLEAKVSQGKKGHGPTTFHPQPVYENLKPSMSTEDLHLSRGQLEVNDGISDITTTANLAYNDTDIWGIFPVTRHSTTERKGSSQAFLQKAKYLELHLGKQQTKPRTVSCPPHTISHHRAPKPPIKPKPVLPVPAEHFH